MMEENSPNKQITIKQDFNETTNDSIHNSEEKLEWTKRVLENNCWWYNNSCEEQWISLWLSYTLYFLWVIAFIAIAITIFIKFLLYLINHTKKQENSKNTMKQIRIWILIELIIWLLFILFKYYL